MTNLFSFVVILGVLVFVHELGHFIVAKLWRIRVEEFGLGYPPRLVRLGKIGDTEYTINLLPLGGFVRLTGEDNPSHPDSFAGKSKLARSSTLLAGPLMNACLAVVLFAATFTLGVLTPVDGPGAGIYSVEPGSPAEQAGLQVGDTILQIDDRPITGPDDVRAYVDEHAGSQVSLIVRREGVILSEPVRLVPRVNPPEGHGRMGVGITGALSKVSYPVWQAIPMGVLELVRVTIMVLEVLPDALSEMLRGPGKPAVTGPIGIAQLTGEVSRFGPIAILRWTALLSANLFLINLFPFPALDGGRLIFILLEALRRGRRVDPRKEGLVHFVGMMVLISLMLMVSYFDLLRLIGGQPVLP